MKSNKQKKQELKIKRANRRKQDRIQEQQQRLSNIPTSILVNAALLTPSNSYDTPKFVRRGYYIDEPFTCRDCGAEEVWTATQQKWWYEVRKGLIYTRAVRCLKCRRKNRAHREKSLKGAEAKRAKLKQR